MPVFSVIISTYNREDYLLKTINSIQCQTFRDIEILICDDGSTDGTADMVSGLQIKDSRIRYFNEGHKGIPAVVRNIGIRNAEGEWLAFCDDDDKWNPCKLEVQLYLVKLHGMKAICTNAFKINGIENTGEKYFNTSKDDIYYFRDFIDVNPVINSSMVIHKSLIEKCKGYPEDEELRALEDYALWLRIASLTPVYYSALPLVEYMLISSSSIRLTRQVSFPEQKRIVDRNYKSWIDEYGLSKKAFLIKEKLMHSLDSFTGKWLDKLRKTKHRII